MKYPSKQYDKLKQTINVLSQYIDNLGDVHPMNVHFLCFQQYSEGQKHNALGVNNEGQIIRMGFVKDNSYKRMFEIDDDFQLYPIGCNDSHVETAVKKSLKELGLK